MAASATDPQAVHEGQCTCRSLHYRLRSDVPVMETCYRRSDHWPAASLERLQALKAEWAAR